MKNQESSGDFNDHQEAQKRKWPYGETDSSYNNNGGVNYSDKSVVVTAAKKCMTTYSAYENYQLNPQYILSECTSNNGQEQQIVEQSDATMTTATQATATSSAESVTVVASAMTPTAAATVSTTTISNCNSNCNQSSSIHMLNAMEIEENIEYVNILYEDDLLTSIQAPVATESHYINFEPPNWSNADILDLDQRNYYYEVNNLNGQMSHHNGHEATIQIQQHHQSQIGQNEIQQHPIEVVPNISHSHVNNSNSNDIHNVADYEVIQNTSYPEAENGREKSVSNLPTVHDDSEDKNLSWLYNYKLNELPHLSPEVNRSRTETGLQVDKLIQEVTASELDSSDQTSSNDNTNPVEPSPINLPKKPPFTYTELIEYALEDKGELTVSGIYNWISDRFPFYKSNDDRWKNSVRHNLSINPHFRKGNKAPQGAGHLWIIHTRDSEANLLAWEHKKQRLELFFKMEKTFGQMEEVNKETQPQNQAHQDETSTAVANLTSILEESTSPGARTEAQYQTTMHVNNQNCADDELKKSAGEILNGIKRTVEVQVVNPSTFNFQDQTILDFPDYLNPVPKDQIVHECGLRSSRNNNNDFCSEYFTSGDMEPIELGINMNTNADNDDDGLFGDEFNLNYFITPGNNIMT